MRSAILIGVVQPTCWVKNPLLLIPVNLLQSSEFVIRLNELENGLLEKLSAAEGDLMENTALIESLEESKALADEVHLACGGERC